MTSDVSDQEIRDAALQYVRKVTGFRQPSKANTEAFAEAVDAVARATEIVLDQIVIRANRP